MEFLPIEIITYFKLLFWHYFCLYERIYFSKKYLRSENLLSTCYVLQHIVSNQQSQDISTVLSASNYCKCNDHLPAKVRSAVYVPYGIDPCEFCRLISIYFYVSPHRYIHFLGSMVFNRKRNVIKTLQSSGILYNVYHRNILYRYIVLVMIIKGVK